MRLGFHYHIPMYRDNAGQLRTPGYLGCFLDSLAVHCDSLVCFMHSPRNDELPQMDYVIQSANLVWVDIGLHTSIPSRMFNSKKITANLRQNLDKIDVLLIRGPSPLLPAMAKVAGDLPIALLLVGDYLAGINDLPQPRWRKEAIRLWSYWNYGQQIRIAQKSLTFVNSRKLYEQLKLKVRNLVETRTTTLSESDFYEREDTCQSEKIKLLYTGRIDRAKGLFDIVDALALLTEQGYDVHLDLVGWPQKGDMIVEELLDFANKRGVNERVVFHGYKAVGNELFDYYKQADIYVIASQSSEGFPRTIWEAMAHSLPVVATSVGSISTFLSSGVNATLVEPKSPSAIFRAIERIIQSPEYRNQTINKGLDLARQNTLEIQSQHLYKNLHAWRKNNDKV